MIFQPGTSTLTCFRGRGGWIEEGVRAAAWLEPGHGGVSGPLTGVTLSASAETHTLRWRKA